MILGSGWSRCPLIFPLLIRRRTSIYYLDLHRRKGDIYDSGSRTCCATSPLLRIHCTPVATNNRP
jgi:hypothetical protein